MKNDAEKNIGIAFLLNFFFSIFELLGGFWTNSISITSDSIHDFGDCLSILISWLLEKKSNKKPNAFYTYGYQKFSVLGALINSVVLFSGASIMFVSAVTRIFDPEEINYNGVLIFAVIGLIVNGIGSYKTIRGEKLSEKVVGLHLLEDVLSWAVVLIAGIVMKIFDLPIIDPILSIFITFFILFNVIRNLIKVFEIFLDKSVINIDELKKDLPQDEQILDIHHLHCWTDGVNNFLTLHLVVSDSIDKDNIIRVKKLLREKLFAKKINHITIELEFASENCSENNCEITKNDYKILHIHHH